MVQTIQRSFTGGEIAPSLRSRADLIKYATGLALCENCFVRSQGGVYSRQGTKFIGEIDDSSRRARLIPFSFNTEQTYMLVFEHQKLQIIKSGGYILDGSPRYEIATPYVEDDLSRLSFTQDADVMTITHPDYNPRNLSRTGDTSWTLSVIDYSPPINPPEWEVSLVANINTITQANPCVVTANAHGFSTDDIVLIESVGGMIELNDNSYEIVVIDDNNFLLKNVDSTAFTAYTSGGTATRDGLLAFGDGAGDYDKTYTYVVTAVNFNGVESIAGDSRSLETASLSETAGIRLTWQAVSGAAYYRVYKDPSNGTGVYGWIGDSNTTTFDDYNIAPVTSDSPPLLRDPFTDIVATITALDVGDLIFTAANHGFNSGETVLIEGINQPTDFNDQSYTIQVIDNDTFQIIDPVTGPFLTYTSGGTATRAGNPPACVGYYQQRQVYANTNADKQSVYTTQTGVYNSLRTSVPSRDDDAITFSLKGNQVNEIRHIVSVDALILLTSGGEWRITEGQDQVLTPSTVGAKIQSQNGVSWVRPAIVGDTLIYIQEKGGRVRDIKYEYVDDKFSGTDLSIMAEHLFEGYEIEEMTHAAEPYGILWLVRNDGKVLGMTYQREHQVWAWHQHDFGGVVESMATITEDGRDAVYMIVKRTVDGSEVRYVERMQQRDVSSSTNVWAVDSGLEYSGVPADNISGLDHLEGESVAVVADGNEVTGMVVSGGAITLPREASRVVVGLPFTPAIELLDIDISSTSETLKGKETTVSRVIIEVEKSRGGWVGPINDDGNVDNMVEIKPRFDSDGYGSIPLRTYKAEVIIDPQWNKGGGIRIEQRSPFPFSVLSVIPDVDVS